MDSATTGFDLHPLIGFSASSKRLQQHLTTISSNDLTTSTEGNTTLNPTVKSFSDSVYYNYYSIGLSLVFEPKKSYKLKSGLTNRTELKEDELSLISIDVYNHQATLEAPSNKSSRSNTSSIKPTFDSFPSYPISITYPSLTAPFTPLTFSITPETTGKDFTQYLGEPDRKGGGEGSMGIWVEWTSNGLLVEFASGGLQAWEKGGEAVWRVITIFERGVSKGEGDGDDDE